MTKSTVDKRDNYYRKSKEHGYRARSAFKLLDIDSRYDIFNNVKRCLDLCAAPGSWSQIASERIKADGDERIIVAIDIQTMEPIPNVIQIQGDITTQSSLDRILKIFNGKKTQLVICDGAPDVTGKNIIDNCLQSDLLYSAITLGLIVLEDKGTFVAKIFQNQYTYFFKSQLLNIFENVYIYKPPSSRESSAEAFIICKCIRKNCILRKKFYRNEIHDNFYEEDINNFINYIKYGDLSYFEHHPVMPQESCDLGLQQCN